MERFKINSEDFTVFLQTLMKKGMINEVLSGKEKGNRYTLEPDFITDPEKLTNLPLSQLLTYSLARTDSPANSILHTQKALKTKIAVIGHACDVRALVEMEKKRQVKWENLFLITYEDMGYVEVSTMMKYLKKEKIEAPQLIGERLTPKYAILKLKDGSMKKVEYNKEFNVSENCSRCVQKCHPMADVVLSTYTLPDNSNEYIFTALSERAYKIVIEDLNWKNRMISDNQNQDYEKEAAEIVKACEDKREKELDEWMAQPQKTKLTLLNKCTGCGLCVKACPVCFCPQCNLLLELKAKHMDKLTFVMTRFTHVGDTCVECGKCQSNCPSGVPLALVFQSLRRKFKARRNYEAGTNPKSKVMHLDI